MTHLPGTAGWPPRTESDLSNAIAHGALEETHFLDIKRELAPGKKGNVELAKDLAQFGTDGGALVLGVAEVDAGPGLHPIPTDGLCERVEQVARTRVVPPLQVACRVIPATDAPGMGFVWVDVPASSSAPHMVDHVYYGRGDKMRHQLDDPEVERLHLARNTSVALADERLNAWVARDPYPPDQRVTAHLYVVIEPASPRRDMAVEWLTEMRLVGLVRVAAEAGSALLDFEQVPEPQLGYVSGLVGDDYHYSVRPEGAALSTRWTRNQPITDQSDDREVELTDAGAVRVLHTGLGSVRLQDEQVLIPGALVVVRHAISIAAEVGRRTGYQGRWLCGVEVNGATGAYVPTPWDRYGPTVDPRITEPIADGHGDVRRTHLATTYELQQTPWLVAAELLGRITRGLGIADLAVVKQILAPPAGNVSGVD